VVANLLLLTRYYNLQLQFRGQLIDVKQVISGLLKGRLNKDPATSMAHEGLGAWLIT